MERVIRKYATINNEPSRTQQQFKSDCNINSIIEKAKRFGMPQPSKTPMFGDFTGLDFAEMQNKVVNASRMFMELPPKVRQRFHHDPAELIRFIENPDNKYEAISLGLIPKPAKLPEGPVPPLDVTGPTDTTANAGGAV